MKRATIACLLSLGLAACQPGGNVSVPGDSNDQAPFAGIAPDEKIRFAGTEPFWGGLAQGDRLVYTTPESADGTIVPVKHFSGRGGLSLSGELDGKRLDLTVTPGECSDGMSDRTYPFVATLMLGDETRTGCAWTDQRGFTGPQNP
ncbi:MAG: hypothetical protein FJX31_02720 [Alphaproteobacteria bacterium]|nr:hypothetical protein [Alphaproteobacteria bacterium]